MSLKNIRDYLLSFDRKVTLVDGVASEPATRPQGGKPPSSDLPAVEVLYE